MNKRTEFIAGITTFFTVSYIVIVNPSILSAEGTGMPFSGVLTATVLLCFLMTLMMGVYAKLPFAVAPGMGINAFFTYSIILGQKVPWPTALGMVFWSGILFLIISLTPIRERIAQAIPLHLRIASAAGIGIFLSFIGLKNAGWVVSDPATLVRLGVLDYRAILTLISICVAFLLLRKKNPFAFLAAILISTLGAASLGKIEMPTSYFAPPDFESVLFKLDFMGALRLSYLPTIISIFFTDLFDSISTFVGVSHSNGLLDEKGQPKNLKQGLIVDAFATTFAGVLGTSAGTAYSESSAGIEVGGRTGLTSVFTAFCFLPCLFLGPLLAAIPVFTTAPVLILVGAFMFKSVFELKVTAIEELLPTFLALILIPLTFSISQGLLWGFFSHAVLFILVGRGRELSKTLLVIAAISGFLLLGR